MKRLTLTFSIALLAFGLASMSMAQDAGPTGGPPRVVIEGKRPGMFAVDRQILGKLNLSRAQVQQVRALIKQTQLKQKELREEALATLDKQDMKAKRKALVEGYHTGLAAILTPGQETQYKELHKEYEAKLKAAKTGTGGTIPPQG